ADALVGDPCAVELELSERRDPAESLHDAVVKEKAVEIEAHQRGKPGEEKQGILRHLRVCQVERLEARGQVPQAGPRHLRGAKAQRAQAGERWKPLEVSVGDLCVPEVEITRVLGLGRRLGFWFRRQWFG